MSEVTKASSCWRARRSLQRRKFDRLHNHRQRLGIAVALLTCAGGNLVPCAIASLARKPPATFDRQVYGPDLEPQHLKEHLLSDTMPAVSFFTAPWSGPSDPRLLDARVAVDKQFTMSPSGFAIARTLASRVNVITPDPVTHSHGLMLFGAWSGPRGSAHLGDNSNGMQSTSW